MHAYHDNLAGFDQRNVLHDGCEECEQRAADPLGQGLPALDHKNRLKLWHDLRAYRFGSVDQDGRNISRCDLRLIDCMYSIACFLERAGIDAAEVEDRMRDENDRLEALLEARR